MSHKRHNQLTVFREWAKHLRPFGRRQFWGKERQAAKREAAKQLKDSNV